MFYTVRQINLYCDTALSRVSIAVTCYAKFAQAGLESARTLLEIQSLSS